MPVNNKFFEIFFTIFFLSFLQFYCIFFYLYKYRLMSFFTFFLFFYHFLFLSFCMLAFPYDTRSISFSFYFFWEERTKTIPKSSVSAINDQALVCIQDGIWQNSDINRPCSCTIVRGPNVTCSWRWWGRWVEGLISFLPSQPYDKD